MNFKKAHFRSPPLKASANGETCVCCGRQDGTVVWAHSNRPEHGKGLSIKAHDLLGLYLCHACHSYYDSCGYADGIKFFREHYPQTMVRVAEKLAEGELKL